MRAWEGSRSLNGMAPAATSGAVGDHHAVVVPVEQRLLRGLGDQPQVAEAALVAVRPEDVPG